MKNLFYIILLFLALYVHKISIAQCDLPTNEQGNYEYVDVINLDSAFSRVKIYNSALISMSSIFKSVNDVIEVKDENAGYIIGKFTTESTPFRLANCISYFRFSIRLDFKDSKYRIVINYLEHNAFSLSTSCSCPNPITSDKCDGGTCLYKYEWDKQRCEAHNEVIRAVENLKDLILKNLTYTEW